MCVCVRVWFWSPSFRWYNAMAPTHVHSHTYVWSRTYVSSHTHTYVFSHAAAATNSSSCSRMRRRTSAHAGREAAEEEVAVWEDQVYMHVCDYKDEKSANSITTLFLQQRSRNHHHHVCEKIHQYVNIHMYVNVYVSCHCNSTQWGGAGQPLECMWIYIWMCHCHNSSSSRMRSRTSAHAAREVAVWEDQVYMHACENKDERVANAIPTLFLKQR